MDKDSIIQHIFRSFQVLKHQMHAEVMKNQKQNVAISQLVVLSIISQSPDKTVKDLSNILGLSPSAGTQLVNSLAKRGLVKRQTSKKDRRAQTLLITQAGKKNLKKAEKMFDDVGKKLFDVLDEKELMQYLTLQNKIIKSIQV